MARIRSVHPGLFTDEAFMEASAMARLLVIGLWTEAWDDGVFEWKPLVLKARIFPADGCDATILLAELSRLNIVKMVERGGKRYGLIRNFCKYQRPKRPNTSGVVTDTDTEYLGLTRPNSSTGSEEVLVCHDESSEHIPHDHPRDECGTRACHGVGSVPVPNMFGTCGGNPPQMEDGGWRMKEEDGETSSQQQPGIESERASGSELGRFDRASADALEARLREAAGYEAQPAPNLCVIGPIEALIGEGFDLEREILPAIRAKALSMPKPAQSWAYFVGVIREARDRSAGAAGGPAADAARIADDMAEARRRLSARAATRGDA